MQTLRNSAMIWRPKGHSELSMHYEGMSNYVEIETSREFLFIFQQKRAWQEEKSDLESQIELITKAHNDDLENERVRL